MNSTFQMLALGPTPGRCRVGPGTFHFKQMLEQTQGLLLGVKGQGGPTSASLLLAQWVLEVTPSIPDDCSRSTLPLIQKEKNLKTENGNSIVLR